MIFFIFLGADLMNSALALTQVPNQLAGLVGGWGLSPLIVVVAILLFYVLLGAVMDELSMLLLTIPIFFPIVMALDFGMPKESAALWFGIMVLMTVGFGLHRAARGAERLHRQRHGQRRADGRDLPRRDALPGERRDPHRCCSCSSRSFRCGWCGSSASGHQGKPRPRTAGRR